MDRTRGRRLQDIRKRWMRIQPLCQSCAAKNPPVVRAATQLDHIVALVNGGSDDDSNRQMLCIECHAEKTAVDIGYKPSGCDAFGIPTSPAHHWTKSNALTCPDPEPDA